ncbi:hypothetical protein SD71_17910 [Cohnella kolymensis]|uniref:DUF2953 domain-containing protein n=1 Tax=Cohnella kolymensis TaxID=1590652 RepID=A0ABR5A1D5_9BACL|nr:DUF2953 domain-containing protein [Cohnella kolymensis]KIL34874.1 hypothetical protein SD71_17910 [Cohnella kolymensis]
MAFWLWLMLALLVVLALIVAAMLSRIRVRVRYSHSGRMDHLVVAMEALYGLFRYQIIIPSIIIRGWNVIYSERTKRPLTGETELKSIKQPIGTGKISRLIKVYRTVIRPRPALRQTVMSALKKLECTRWRLDFRVGTGDPASTGVTTGLLWAVSGCIVGAASQLITLKTSPQGRIEPNYCGTEFAVVWESDYEIRLAAAMWSTMKLGTKAIEMGKSLRYWTHLLQGPKQA